jgi:hypothetical protein
MSHDFSPGTYRTDALAYAGGKLARPVPIRDRWGRMRRAPGGEWDWFYELEPSERRWLSAHHMTELGAAPDEVATMHGVSVDEAMGRWLLYVRLSRARSTPLGDDFDPSDALPDDAVSLSSLVGPSEVGVMLGVRSNTVAQWRVRFPDFPLPLATISGVRLWHRTDVIEWASAHGRLVESA